jgi:hypothetical protein
LSHTPGICPGGQALRSDYPADRLDRIDVPVIARLTERDGIELVSGQANRLTNRDGRSAIDLVEERAGWRCTGIDIKYQAYSVFVKKDVE